VAAEDFQCLGGEVVGDDHKWTDAGPCLLKRPGNAFRIDDGRRGSTHARKCDHGIARRLEPLLVEKAVELCRNSRANCIGRYAMRDGGLERHFRMTSNAKLSRAGSAPNETADGKASA
jgi:hypothetical protein